MQKLERAAWKIDLYSSPTKSISEWCVLVKLFGYIHVCITVSLYVTTCSMSASRKKADLKVIIMGASNVGKTTLIHRYIHGELIDPSSTIGASFMLKQWGRYNIAIWDTAGEERFSGLSSFYCRGAGAAILAYEVTSEDSFHALRARFVPLLESAEPNCLCVVVGTKADLLNTQPRQVARDDALRLAQELNPNNSQQLACFDTSSLDGRNVNQVFEYIFKTSIGSRQPVQQQSSTSSTVNLTEHKADEQKGKSCCR